MSTFLFKLGQLASRHLPLWLDQILPDIDLDGHRDSAFDTDTVSSATRAGAR